MRKTLIGGIVVVGLFVAFVLGVLWPPKQRTDAINREDADRIVNALEAYQRANHAYPAELKELAPKFIPQVPAEHHRNGNTVAFWYEPGDDKRSYVLRYDEAPLLSIGADAYFQYDSQSHAWKN